jgi:two-component system chemotaxis response regulator CheB
VLSKDPEIEVVATAADPFDARDKIVEHEPDVRVVMWSCPK